MYIGARGDSGRSQDRVDLPEKYSGNAFTEDGVLRVSDADALKRAEEAFRRGYVFEPDGDGDGCMEPESEGEAPPSEPTDIHTADRDAPAASAAANGNVSVLRRSGVISELFKGITAEHIILLAAVFILWDSRADDELLLLLILLLFC